MFLSKDFASPFCHASRIAVFWMLQHLVKVLYYENHKGAFCSKVRRVIWIKRSAYPQRSSKYCIFFCQMIFNTDLPTRPCSHKGRATDIFKRIHGQVVFTKTFWWGKKTHPVVSSLNDTIIHILNTCKMWFTSSFVGPPTVCYFWSQVKSVYFGFLFRHSHSVHSDFYTIKRATN